MSTASTATGDDPLEKARRLMTAAVAPNSTAESRRIFRSHLITLASDPSYEHKAFFGTLVSKFFGEFEDLQDATIDALLDLCEDEDEKVRIIGIKGLGPTGRADPRWVKGNTGVLLQLLACQPRELKHVRESLQMLLTVSPIDVLSVMIDDCRGSEEETGASRRNIIEYLYNDARGFRRDTLENRGAAANGNSNGNGNGDKEHAVEVERVFREGFLEVLDRVKGEEEVRMILDMLKDLPSISGQGATPETKTRFLRALTRSSAPRSGANPEESASVLHIFVEYVERASPVDPRYAMSFVGVHGKALIKLALAMPSAKGESDASKDSISARKALQGLRKWVDAALDQWANDKSRTNAGQDKDVSEEGVARDFIEVVLYPLVTLSRNIIASNGSLVEIVLYAIYRLATISDRRSWISSSDARGLSEIAREASRIERQTSLGSMESKMWRNVTDMAEILSDTRSRITRISPSWSSAMSRQQPLPPSRPSAMGGPSSSSLSSAMPPSGPRNGGTARAGSTSTSTLGSSGSSGPSAPRGPRDRDRETRAPPAGPRAGSSRVADPSSTAKPPPTGPRPSNGSATAGRVHPTHDTHDRDRDSRGPSTHGMDRPTRVPRSPVRRRSASPTRAKTDKSDRRDASPGPASASKESPQRPPTPPLPSEQGPIITNPAQGLAIRSAAKSTSLPAASAPESGKPLSTRLNKVASEAAPPVRGTPTLLADRLGTTTSATTSSPSPSGKRQREEETPLHVSSPEKAASFTPSTDRPSLLSRLNAKGMGDDAPRPKRAKEDASVKLSPAPSAPTTASAKLSLRDRLNGKSDSTLPGSPSSSPAAAPTGPRGLSILSRSTSSSSPQTAQGATPTPSQPKGLSILSRSTQPKSPNPPANNTSLTSESKPEAEPKRPTSFSILRHASSSAATPTRTSNARSEDEGAGRLLREQDAKAKPKEEEEEEVIVRKGRGFRAKTPDDDILMVDASAHAQAISSPGMSVASNIVANGGGLAGRLGMGAHGVGGGLGSIRGRAGAQRGVRMPLVSNAGRGRGLVRPDRSGMGTGRGR
ncbi:hypothetical protein IAU59_002310 [Kwoniella sp. CBS 9459]